MEPVVLTYNIDGENYIAAGEASTSVKKVLKKLGLSTDVIRRAVVCMYEGEINMVIHANGGTAEVRIEPDCITIILDDVGPGIKDVDQAMQEGYSTAEQMARDMGFGAGMGLPNMKRNSDEMTVETVIGKGTKVTMKIFLNKG